MQNAFSSNYIAKLTERTKKSRVRTAHQHAGLVISAILDDPQHKSLYMKLAKRYNTTELITLAKSIADRRNVKNKGAYFMHIVTERIQEEEANKKKDNANTNTGKKGKRGVPTDAPRRNAARRRTTAKTTSSRA